MSTPQYLSDFQVVDLCGSLELRVQYVDVLVATSISTFYAALPARPIHLYIFHFITVGDYGK